VCERVAVNQLGDQVEGVVHGTRLVQRHDRRVRQSSARQRLARDALRVLSGRQRNALDGHVAAKLLVVCAPHDAKAARAEALAQAVAPEHQRLLGGAVRPGFWRARACARPRRRDEGTIDEGLRLHRLLRSP